MKNNTQSTDFQIQSPVFESLKKKLENKKNKMYDIQKKLIEIKKEIKKDTEELQNSCIHQFERECTTTGCYAEYEWICRFCRKYR